MAEKRRFMGGRREMLNHSFSARLPAPHRRTTYDHLHPCFDPPQPHSGYPRPRYAQPQYDYPRYESPCQERYEQLPPRHNPYDRPYPGQTQDTRRAQYSFNDTSTSVLNGKPPFTDTPISKPASIPAQSADDLPRKPQPSNKPSVSELPNAAILTIETEAPTSEIPLLGGDLLLLSDMDGEKSTAQKALYLDKKTQPYKEIIPNQGPQPSKEVNPQPNQEPQPKVKYARKWTPRGPVKVIVPPEYDPYRHRTGVAAIILDPKDTPSIAIPRRRYNPYNDSYYLYEDSYHPKPGPLPYRVPPHYRAPLNRAPPRDYRPPRQHPCAQSTACPPFLPVESDKTKQTDFALDETVRSRIMNRIMLSGGSSSQSLKYLAPKETVQCTYKSYMNSNSDNEDLNKLK